ncbi:GlsB/YeaQ/YmgE family stress response membrane protein [Pseudonocardia sp. EV170527-09]|uniref:GlsB/YeaQ/YmgE family stress response membrane protein n=1 Tax=Pseudonocardia sp. EV170527-09 TaxID=2603411 RepID=UPI0011F35A84|nr:GlsB/YeaQ/YmgE family stress response membrane protein [Pseudonocardia sp. EV170527-09]KAA1019124.1 GlsB/YeaQ/YmgE family stress response membrane protein [Pseudonocardia sp. EV170527-09]
MGIIAWIVLGLIAGAIAKAIMPGKDPGGIIITLILGVVGALLGGWIGSAVFGVGLGGFFNISTWLLAIVGALILLAIYRVIVGRKVRA